MVKVTAAVDRTSALGRNQQFALVGERPHKFWKEHCASGYEPSFGRFARNWGYRSSRAFCPKSMSTCSSRYHRISRSATSFAVSKGAHRIAFRWSSQNFANVTGVAISGRGATSAPPAATSQTRRYFSISSIMNLPASAGSYSVLTWTIVVLYRRDGLGPCQQFFIRNHFCHPVATSAQPLRRTRHE